jgi:hypothetical protein
MTALLPGAGVAGTVVEGAVEPDTDRWHSRHLHVASADPQALENVVTAVVAPTMVELTRSHGARPWFFMRYWQRGPHVRLRVADLDAAAGRTWVDELGERRALEVFVSQLHMTQNRLGVGGGREAHLSAALLELL